MEGYLAAGDLGNRLPVRLSRCAHLRHTVFPDLTPADIAAIDSAGEKGARREIFIKTLRVIAGLMLFGAVIYRIYALLEPGARYSWGNVC